MKKIFLILVFGLIIFSCNKLSEGEHFASINGNQLQYFIVGEGPLVLFPSQGQGIPVDDLIEPFRHLGKYYKIVFYNTRGSGQSTGPADKHKYGSNEYISDIEEFRKYFSTEKIWLIGHSGGAFQVLNYASSFPDRVNGLIVISAMVSPDNLYKRELLTNIKKWKGIPDYEKRVETFFGRNTEVKTIEEFNSLILPFYFYDQEKYREISKNNVLKVSEFVKIASRVSHFAENNILFKLRSITSPTLIIVGDNDMICDEYSQSRRIHQEIKNSQLVRISNSGHMPWIENKNDFNSALEKWINYVL